MPDQTNDAVSDERLRELEFCPFCSGEVTHVESWAKSFKPPILYIEYHHDCAMFPHRVWSFPASSELNSAFVAAWNRRSVTSQASEGAGPDDFAVGMAVAAGIAISAHGAETVAEEILRAGNLDTLKAMRVAGVDRYDIRLCLPVLKHIRDKSASRRQALQGGRS
jgi:hypothetical protein